MNEKGKLAGNWLAMDTSTTAMTIALLKDGALLGESESESERNHSIRLLPAVQELLSSVGMKAKDLNGIVVGHGPGSYTGIRISVTVGKTFAWSLGLPLIGISSLESLAYGVVLRGDFEPGERVWVVPYMDARRGQGYTGLYQYTRDGWSCLEPDGIRPMEQWLEQLSERLKVIESESGAAPKVYFAGYTGGFAALLENFGTAAQLQTVIDETPLKAAAVGALAQLYGMEKVATDIHGFEPNYTQLSEPEKNLVVKNR